MTMEKKQPAKSSTSGVARAWRVFLGMLLGMVAFIALAAAGVFGLFASVLPPQCSL
jgi:threonine/homoserine/homoserine lactone efflux protein